MTSKKATVGNMAWVPNWLESFQPRTFQAREPLKPGLSGAKRGLGRLGNELGCSVEDLGILENSAGILYFLTTWYKYPFAGMRNLCLSSWQLSSAS